MICQDEQRPQDTAVWKDVGNWYTSRQAAFFLSFVVGIINAGRRLVVSCHDDQKPHDR